VSAGDLPGLLAALEARLAALGAPVVGAFRPGAPAGRVRRVAGASPDLAAWWGWHDGAGGRPVTEGPGIVEGPDNRLVGNWHAVSLADAQRIERWVRAELQAVGMSELVPPAWFPVLHYGGVGATLWLDRGTGALYVVDPHGGLPEDPPEPQFGSLADLVGDWLRILDRAGADVPEDLLSRHPYW
jgi:hypothetical protein